MKIKKGVVSLCRIVLALVFVFSGFVKAVDPWGTAIKLGEYFHAFGISALAGAGYGFSVALSAGEMLLGFCLLLRLGKRKTEGLMLVVVSFFALWTLMLAIWNPVSDCGCFGDAVKLTNWQTFYKNIVLLALAVIVYAGGCRKKECWDWNPGASSSRSNLIEWSLGLLFLFFSLGVGLYSLRHLPLIDFLPFKTGVNVAVRGENPQGELLTTLIYKDKTTGQNREFSLTDTTWYDSTRWEFVDTRIVEQAAAQGKVDPAVAEFSIFRADGDRTPELLARTQEWFLVTLTDPAQLTGPCRERLEDAARYAKKHGLLMIGVTPVSLAADSTLVLGEERIPLYNIDGTTLKTLIRAHEGLVVVKEGTILAKWNCLDIPQLSTDHADRSMLSLVAAQPEQIALLWFLGVCGVVLGLICILYFIYRRRG